MTTAMTIFTSVHPTRWSAVREFPMLNQCYVTIVNDIIDIIFDINNTVNHLTPVDPCAGPSCRSSFAFGLVLPRIPNIGHHHTLPQHTHAIGDLHHASSRACDVAIESEQGAKTPRGGSSFLTPTWERTLCFEEWQTDADNKPYARLDSQH